MALQENVGVRLSYKANVSGDMTANTEADTSTIPGTGSAQQLRRVTSTLALTKDSYQSQEIRTSRQVSDMRHGTKRVAGEISGELSPATYWDFIEAVCRGTEVAEISKSNSEFTSLTADNATSKLTVGGSTWAAQGFQVGDVIRCATLSEALNNSRNFQIYALDDVDAFVFPAPTDMGADTSFTVVRSGKKVSMPSSGHVKRLFTFEHYHSDIDVTELFTECRAHRLTFGLPATGLATIGVGITGRGKTTLSAGDSPYFSNPTAANTNGIAAAVNGRVMFQNEAVGVITGIELTVDTAVDAPAVVGQDFVPEIFLGRSVVTGTLTALFENSDFLSAFEEETEVEILLMLTTTSAADSPFIAITLPRVKFSAANLPLQGEAGLPISLPFQALEQATSTGLLASSVGFQDSES